MTRVLIADDQALFREGLRAVLSARGVEVVGEAATGERAVELALELSPDVVLMDLRMPGAGGVAAIRRITAASGAPRVIALTTFDDDESVFEALRAGALGYLLKDTGSERLCEAIELAARGESLLQPSVAARLVSEFARLAPPVSPERAAADLGLTEREVAVLKALGDGASNKEVATTLGIAEGTVKNHVTSILTKLGVEDRVQAALRARELGIVSSRAR